MKKQFDMQGWLYKQWKKSNGLNEEKQHLKEEYIESMDSVRLDKHLKEIEKHCGTDVSVIVMANKSDYGENKQEQK